MKLQTIQIILDNCDYDDKQRIKKRQSIINKHDRKRLAELIEQIQ